MSSENRPRFYHRLAFRLSLWYGGILLLCSLLCLVSFYTAMVAAMRDRADSYLTALGRRVAALQTTESLDAGVQELSHEVQFAGANDVFFRILTADGQTLFSSDLALWQDTGIQHRQALAASDATPLFEDWDGTAHHSKVRVMTLRIGDGKILQMGESVAGDQRVMEQSRQTTSLTMFGIVAVAVLAGWGMGHRALRRVQQLKETADQITGGDLVRRVEVTGRRDEIDRLAVTFNGMLDRIEALVQEMKQTNDNIAHELRSPVTRMRGLAETTLVGKSAAGDFRDMAANTVEECDRLLGIINTMLDIAEAEGRVTKWPVETIDLSAIARDACELYEPVADLRGISICLDAHSHSPVMGNTQQLQRAIANLLDNAIKYSPPDATVRIQVADDRTDAIITVRNPGPGISAEELPRIFDRFYRCQAGRALPGTGLGLSLSRAIIRAHGGSLTAASEPGIETTFTVRLPRQVRSN